MNREKRIKVVYDKDTSILAVAVHMMTESGIGEEDQDHYLRMAHRIIRKEIHFPDNCPFKFNAIANMQRLPRDWSLPMSLFERKLFRGLNDLLKLSEIMHQVYQKQMEGAIKQAKADFESYSLLSKKIVWNMYNTYPTLLSEAMRCYLEQNPYNS